MAPSSVWLGSSGNKLKESSELFRSDLLQSLDGSVGEFDAGRDDDLDDGCEGGCDGGCDVEVDCFNGGTGFAGICVGSVDGSRS